MLPFLDKGMPVSANKHNCDLQLFCDWIEGSLLFKDETRLSRTDIVDVLCESGIYSDQDFASDWLDNVWTELARRQRVLDETTPFDVAMRAITRERKWTDVPAYAFCVLAPLLQSSATWLPTHTSSQRAKHYAQQGALFERISEEALRAAGWQTHRTGWSTETPARLPDVVAKVARRLGESVQANWAMNVSGHANEAGLDVVFFRDFADGRCGFPVYLTQCAAGDDWDTKLHTPVLSVWQKLVDFPMPPHKAFALPHSLGADELRRITVKVSGVVLDRYRLHDASRGLNWSSRALTKDLKAFLKPLIAQLPSYS